MLIARNVHSVQNLYMLLAFDELCFFALSSNEGFPCTPSDILLYELG